MTRLMHMRAGLLATMVVAALFVLAAPAGFAQTANHSPKPTVTTYELTSHSPSSAVASPYILISGDCGKVNFINYGNGNFYVIVDSFKGSMWWIDWHVQSAIAGTGGTRYPNSTHAEWPGHVNVPGWPQGLVLTGDAFTSGAGYCYFVPNPA